MQTSEQQLVISEDRIITPLTEVLNSAVPSIAPLSPRTNGSSKSFVDSLDTLFPEQQREERNIKQTKEILGNLADEFSLDQLKIVITEVEYLAESWLDDFERIAFKGQTLQELLHERTGL